ncbi:hypothetical protein D3C84_400230 [compost metagenome]
MDLTRTLIIGNSGSGKSWLAQQLAGPLQATWVDLDSIHWLSDEHSIARPRAEALGMARIAHVMTQVDLLRISGCSTGFPEPGFS